MADPSGPSTGSPRGALGRTLGICAALTLGLLLVMVLGLAWGSTGEHLIEVLRGLLRGEIEESVHWTIIRQIRLPRVLLAAAVGATLGIGGLVFQALLRNPLAEPYILGVSGGSAVGAVLGMMLGLRFFPGVAGLAFSGSLATLLLVLLLASRRRLVQENSLLLAGVMVNAFCSAIITFLISITEHTKLQGILFWLMGDLSSSNITQVGGLGLLILPSFFLVFVLARPMNLLQFGRDAAHSMGVNVKAVTFILLIVTSLTVSASVCLVGLVGFVGLVIPHLLRMLLGPDHRLLVPACVLGGAMFMTGCDLLARLASGQGQLPVGVVTALIGAPAFIFLLARSKQ
ncbi:FecCD family ABC transporter permease [Desulfovermiculus halophilus]|uniref:FecCD family ABC transporter permease n=1 Tax=Desulfovermiculus halophilus TaxID=339722 RepID=UPI000684989A|nr:iron ABC transporter permease [Desulfovermiculus halophilus]